MPHFTITDHFLLNNITLLVHDNFLTYETRHQQRSYENITSVRNKKN